MSTPTTCRERVNWRRQTGATLLLPAQQRVRFAFTAIADGERIPLGSASLTAMRTPGHTDESTSYALNETAVFTGDTLFTNGVGRPDLHADTEGARQRAHALFASLTRLRTLPPHMRGAARACQRADRVRWTRRRRTQMGEIETWLSGWLASEAAFVDRVTSQAAADAAATSPASSI